MSKRKLSTTPRAIARRTATAATKATPSHPAIVRDPLEITEEMLDEAGAEGRDIGWRNATTGRNANGAPCNVGQLTAIVHQLTTAIEKTLGLAPSE